jgi:hypothetical protein
MVIALSTLRAFVTRSVAYAGHPYGSADDNDRTATQAAREGPRDLHGGKHSSGRSPLCAPPRLPRRTSEQISRHTEACTQLLAFSC